MDDARGDRHGTTRKQLLKRGLALSVAGAGLATLGNSRAVAGAATPTQAKRFALIGGSVLTEDGSGWRRDHAVLVDDGRIVAIAPRRELAGQLDAAEIDVTGRWVIPGLTDCHMHFGTEAAQRPINEHVLGMYLVNGITSVVCLIGSPSVLELARDVAAGAVAGPEVRTAGPRQGFEVEHETMTYQAGYEEAIAQADAGYHMIKVYTFLSLAGYRGLLAGAAAAGIPVVGHIPGPGGVTLHKLVRLGQSAVTHAEEFVYWVFPPARYNSTRAAAHCWGDLERCYRRPARTWEEPGFGIAARDEVARRVAGAEIRVTPTLQTFKAIVNQAEDVDTWFESQPLEYMPASLVARWRGENPFATAFNTPEHRRAAAEALAFQVRLVESFHRAGVRLTAGTDALIPGLVPGFSLVSELGNLAAAGLGNAGALHAATTAAGEYPFYTGPDRLGVLATGARADITVLAADPLEDALNTREVHGVLTHGAWRGPDELESLRRQLRAASPSL